MPRPRSREPTEGELEILNVLWDEGPSGLGTICAAIRDRRSVATTTVATMLKVMMEKGLVKRAQGERGLVWSARISRRVATRGLVRRLLDSTFEGSATMLVSHLLEDGKLSERDRRAILEMLGRGGNGGGG